jgi:hypothetical protein
VRPVACSLGPTGHQHARFIRCGVSAEKPPVFVAPINALGALPTMWWLFAGRASYCASALAAAIIFANVQVPQAALAADSSKTVAGIWGGTYKCAQRLRKMRLKVFGERELTAHLCFGKPETSANGCVGEYELKGAFDPVRDVIELFPSRWIHEAPGELMLGLKGHLSKDQQTLIGTIDAPSCGNFVLERPRTAITPKVLSAGDRAIGLGALTLLLAAPLTLFVSFLLLEIYLGVLKRSMLRQAPGPKVLGSPAKASTLAVTSSPARLEISETAEIDVRVLTAIELKQRALRGRWWTAAVYIVAGLAFAVTMATVHSAALGEGFVPRSFLYKTVTYAWPTVLTVGLVAAVSWRDWLIINGITLVCLASSLRTLRCLGNKQPLALLSIRLSLCRYSPGLPTPWGRAGSAGAL